jgi:wobble nucleotide-excising tRNase
MIISKILRLQNVGLLQDATQTGAVSLGKVTAVYADNGRGKSTLATVLRACQLGDEGRLNSRKTIDGPGNPEVELLLPTGSHVEFKANAWTATLPDIVVFDSEFIEQNVYSGLEVRADHRQSLLEFALGNQTVQLKQQIDQLTQDIDTQTRKRTAAEKTLTGYATPYNVTQFIALQPVPDAQQQIDAFQKRIQAAKNAQALAARKDPTSIATIQFDMAAFSTVLKTQMHDVEKAAEAVVKEHLAKHNSHDIEDWASRGQQYIGRPECPFCGQAFGGLVLIEAYRSYFNKAYADLKRRVAELESVVATGLAASKIEDAVSSAATNTARIEAWKDQLNVSAPALDGVALAAALRQVREKLQALVGAKQRAPLECVGSQADAEAATEAIAGITQAIAAYNADVQVATVQIGDFRKRLGAENTTVLADEIRKLEAAKKRVRPDVMTAVAEYQAAETERKRLDGEKTKARQQLDSLMQATLQQYQTSINDLLTAFGAEFSIEQLKPTYLGGGEPRSEYGLCVRNKSVKLGSRADIATGHSFATTLSEADKRTLAFAFFVARLKADANLAGKLVVLDDPVSSLDRNRRHQSIRHITNLAGECGQLLVLSHDAYFVRELREWLSDLRPTPIQAHVLTIKRVGNGYSAFAQCDIDDVCSSDYYRHHRLVADYVDGTSTANTRDVAKAIRPMLEGYYHRRFPGKIPRKLMFGQIIAHAAKAPAGDPLAYLQPMQKELDEVNDYARQFHHDTNPGFEGVPVVDGELIGFAMRALNLIYQAG